jgi:RND family efflux transporter MFP subunit
MDATNVRIALQNAQALERLAAANLAAAEKEAARGQALFAEQSLPASAWEKIQAARDIAAAQHDQARAGLRAAEQALADCTLTAPFAGAITAKHRNAGDTVTLMPVSPILSLTDLDHLEARLAVPEVLEGFVKVGQRIQAVTSPGGQRFEARVRVKNPVIDPASRTVEVLADVARVEGGPLRPGVLVNADFGSYGENVLFVPTTALRTEGQASYLLVVAGGKAERRNVEIAPVHPGTVAVTRGLEAQADVILDPGSLAAGDAVVALPN